MLGLSQNIIIIIIIIQIIDLYIITIKLVLKITKYKTKKTQSGILLNSLYIPTI